MLDNFDPSRFLYEDIIENNMEDEFKNYIYCLENVEEIKRENFTNPKREDEYGTSVISIQFSRGNIERISVINEKENKIIKIITSDENNIIIKLDKTNKIVGYENEKLEWIGDYFLHYNKVLTELNLPNLSEEQIENKLIRRAVKKTIWNN